MYLNVYPVLNTIADLQKAHVVGTIPTDPSTQKSPDLTTFCYAGFVSPGKHSIYLYDIETDTFWKKVIIVDVQKNGFI